MKRFLVASFAILLSNNAYAEGIPCWIRCHCPPRVASAADVPAVLRSSPNPSLTFLARGAGVFTTYLGKILGLQGWRDYHLRGTARGRVVHAAGSTDGLYTIDLRIERLYIEDDSVILPRSPNFIRVEVFPFARAGAPLPVRENEEVCISGKFMWDADGFLEIHPKKPADFSSNRCNRPEN